MKPSSNSMVRESIFFKRDSLSSPDLIESAQRLIFEPSWTRSSSNRLKSILRWVASAILAVSIADFILIVKRIVGFTFEESCQCRNGHHW
jgi:hypothetical protein